VGLSTSSVVIVAKFLFSAIINHRNEEQKMTGRTFTASLKPAWDEFKIAQFIASMTGTAIVWVINHDQDTNDDGEILENHTHILIDYETPRKITTVANLLEVDTNFIELVKSKNKMLQYLTHINEPKKFKYDHDLVWTNSSISYADSIGGSLMTDRQIADYIKDGRMTDLLGLVPAHKLRTIQSLLNFDNSGEILRELQLMKTAILGMSSSLMNIETMATNFQNNLQLTAEQLRNGFGSIAEAIKQVGQHATIQRQNVLNRRRK
jgi:hypothetical protein